MSERQPAVHRNQPRFDRKAEERQQEHGPDERVGKSAGSCPHCREFDSPRGIREEHERYRRGDRTSLAHRQHDIAGMRALRAFVFVIDQKVAGDRHQLPCNQKRDRVICEEDQHDRGKQRVIENAEISQTIMLDVFRQVRPGEERYREEH